MDSPLSKLSAEWNAASADRREEIQEIWPGLAMMLDGLVEMNSRIITGESPGMVPTVAPASPGSGPRSPSVTRSGHRGTEPTSTPVSGVEMPIFLEAEDK